MEFHRQKDIFDPSKHKETISLIGCGSVGSFSAIALSKMGCKLTDIYDSDTIESHNLPNQFYKINQLSLRKSKSLALLLNDFSGEMPTPRDNLLEKELLNTDIVISAVDSMAARKLIWENVKASKKVRFYIDSRMGGRIFSLFSVDMKKQQNIRDYETTLVDDSQTAELRCTERTIIFNVLGLASFICNSVSDFLNKKEIVNELHFDYSTFTICPMKWS